MNDVLESIDGFVAMSNAMWGIHLSHLPELSEKARGCSIQSCYRASKLCEA